MIPQLFAPRNKIQKDKQIVHEVDHAIALHGRRALLAACVVFPIYLFTGSLFERAPRIGYGLGTALVLLTIIQAYLSLSFSNQYPRGASRWRNQYLFSSLMGHIWLGCLLAEVVVYAGISVETLIVSMLTMVYLFTSVAVFAPYQNFSRTCIVLVCLLPILALLSISTFESFSVAVAYSIVCAVLFKQIKLYSNNFWNFHETNFLLSQKMSALEAQNKNDNAKIELNYEFLANLGRELKTALNDILGGITLLQDSDLTQEQKDLMDVTEKASERQLQLVDNIVDFAKISKKSLVLEHSIFNLRRELENLFHELANDAHQVNVELNYAVSENVPHRLKGDSTRLRQIVTALTNNVVRFSEGGNVFIEVGAQEICHDQFQLVINFYDEGGSSLVRDNSMLFDAFTQIKHTKAGTGMELAICKGLAECMGGAVGISKKTGTGNYYWLKIPLEVKAVDNHYFVPNSRLLGVRILAISVPHRIAAHLKREFKSWGLEVDICGDFREALEILTEAGISKKPYTATLYFTKLTDDSIINSFKRIAAKPEYLNIYQFIVASDMQLHRNSWVNIFDNYPQLIPVSKPLNYKLFHQSLTQHLFNVELSVKKAHFNSNSNHALASNGCKILLVEDHRVNQLVAEGMLKKLGYKPQLAKNGREALDLIEKEKFDLVLMDCQMAEMDGYQATQEIRLREKDLADEVHIPIIALTAHTAEEDKSRCLAAGMDDYLPKPVRYNDLESRLRRWLGDQQAMRHH